MTPLRVLVHERDWIAVEKPSGLPTTAPPTSGVRSLVDRVRHELLDPRARHAHPLSRLDVEVTGVVLFALSERAIEAAERVRALGQYARRYVALLAREPEGGASGTWSWPIGADPRDRKLRKAASGLDERDAITRYETLGTAAARAAFVALDLATGRTHQIRAHAQRAGCPVLGDRAYGGARHLALADGTVVTARRVMLHARRVGIPGEARVVECEPPADFQAIWAALGGGALPPS